MVMDIVERLRADDAGVDDCNDAADEVERLRELTGNLARALWHMHKGSIVCKCASCAAVARDMANARSDYWRTGGDDG